MKINEREQGMKSYDFSASRHDLLCHGHLDKLFHLIFHVCDASLSSSNCHVIPTVRARELSSGTAYSSTPAKCSPTFLAVGVSFVLSMSITPCFQWVSFPPGPVVNAIPFLPAFAHSSALAFSGTKSSREGM